MRRSSWISSFTSYRKEASFTVVWRNEEFDVKIWRLFTEEIRFFTNYAGNTPFYLLLVRGWRRNNAVSREVGGVALFEKSD